MPEGLVRNCFALAFFYCGNALGIIDFLAAISYAKYMEKFTRKEENHEQD